ncbi:MAG: FAD-dependent oxidoreductase [Dehalococcoidales bacterium]|nr:FAD-dependent oxidoreductase [Dehalococcoidales bacterium]
MRYNFEMPPDPISNSEILQTIETEIVVIGAGTAGLVCANAAVENGAKVILISASSHPIARGGSNHAINTKLARSLDINYDIGTNFKREIDRAGGRFDHDKWSLFAKKSGEAMDWLIDKMTAAGYEAVIEMGEVDPDGIVASFPGSHGFLSSKMKTAGAGQPFVVNTLANLAQSTGVQIHYNTVAKQLIREHNKTGRVTAVIATNPEGKYVKYVGSKAIVLATGDFTKDKEMISKYCPDMLPLVSDTPVNYNAQFILGGIYAGDGHKMGLWVGAAWQKTVPNAPLVAGMIGPMSAHRPFKGLLVNKNGERFASEDISRAQLGLIQMRQPDWKIYAIWDSKYAERMAPWYPPGSCYGGPEQSAEDVVAGWERNVQYGKYFKADTIEELAGKLSLDANKVKTTVAQYNRFCKTGTDEDFFKRKDLLTPVDNPPFYGQSKNSPDLLFVTGGLRTNLDMQVLDTKNQVIPGLYAVGTIVGDMFANYYTFMVPGINLGATCVTFGYLAGKKISGS